ncbi:unnamed protein product, partial [Iphiclides podalirius]
MDLTNILKWAVHSRRVVSSSRAIGCDRGTGARDSESYTRAEPQTRLDASRCGRVARECTQPAHAIVRAQWRGGDWWGGVKNCHWGVSRAALQRSNSMPESGETPEGGAQPQPCAPSPPATPPADASRTPSSCSTCTHTRIH